MDRPSILLAVSLLIWLVKGTTHDESSLTVGSPVKTMCCQEENSASPFQRGAQAEFAGVVAQDAQDVVAGVERGLGVAPVEDVAAV